jgi:hypothetical protein
MKPPVRSDKNPPRRRSLADAITQVLSTNEPRPKEVHPSLLGGRDNPFQLGAISSVGGPLPQPMAERVFNNIDALDGDYYGGNPAKRALRQVRDNMGAYRMQERPVDTANHEPPNQESIDGFARYLGLPQPNRSLEPSPYNPTNAREKGVYVRAPRVWDALLSARSIPFSSPFGESGRGGDYIRPRPSITDPRRSAVRMMLDATEAGPAHILGDDIFEEDNMSAALLANFTLDKGEDEEGPYISLYDRYDLDRVPLADKVVGQPFEIYDRLYYDPETYEPRRVPKPMEALTARGRP